MNNRSSVKITVMKKMTAQEIFGEKVPEIVEEGHHICRRTKVGMEFIVKEEGFMPPGFCSHAWHDISPQVWALQFGAQLREARLVETVREAWKFQEFKMPFFGHFRGGG